MQLITETQCALSKPDFEIYFADSGKKEIYHVVRYKNQSGFKVKPLSLPNKISDDVFPLSLDVHLTNKFIYWADGKTHKVRLISYSSSLREKCPFSKFLWSVFSHIRTE